MRPISRPAAWYYDVIYVGLIVFFCYFYTAVTFNPVDVADNLKKYGGFIPGIRPGRYTADYIDRVLTRITLGGAIYVSAVCVLPTILITRFNVPFYFGGTALLIVVGVAIDTIGQIETHLLTRNYEGFMKRGRVPVEGESASPCDWFCWARRVRVRVRRRGCSVSASAHPQIASGDLLREAVRDEDPARRPGQSLHGQRIAGSRRAGA